MVYYNVHMYICIYYHVLILYLIVYYIINIIIYLIYLFLQLFGPLGNENNFVFSYRM